MTQEIDRPEIDQSKRKTLFGALTAICLPVAARLPFAQVSASVMKGTVIESGAAVQVAGATPGVLETFAALISHRDAVKAVDELGMPFGKMGKQYRRRRFERRTSGQPLNREIIEEDLEQFFHEAQGKLATYYHTLQVMLLAKAGVDDLMADRERILELKVRLNYLNKLQIDSPIAEDHLTGLQKNFIESHKAYVAGIEQTFTDLEQKYGVDRDTLFTVADDGYLLSDHLSPKKRLLYKVQNIVNIFQVNYDLEKLPISYDGHRGWDKTASLFLSEVKQQMVDAFMFSICGESGDNHLSSSYMTHEINPPNFCTRLNIPGQIRAYEQRHTDIELIDLISEGQPGREEKLKGIRVPFHPGLSIEQREAYFLEGVREYAPQWTEHYEKALYPQRQDRTLLGDHYGSINHSPHHPFPKVDPDGLAMLKSLLPSAEGTLVKSLAGTVAQAILKTEPQTAPPDRAPSDIIKADEEPAVAPALLTYEPPLDPANPVRPVVKDAAIAYIADPAV